MGAHSFPSALDSNTAPMAWVVNKPHPLVSIWKRGVSVSNLGNPADYYSPGSTKNPLALWGCPLALGIQEVISSHFTPFYRPRDYWELGRHYPTLTA